MLNIIRKIGKKVINNVIGLGRFIIFFFDIFKGITTRPFPIKSLLEQLVEMWIKSLPLIAMTALFTGAVLALQSYTGFSRMHAESSIASIVVISITRELGPVLSGLMFAGRLGASISAEIGTMKVTDQISAFDMMCSINTKTYLVLPRIIAGVIALPLLVVCADIIGIFGGYMVATTKLGFDSMPYLQKTISFMQIKDVVSGLIKAFFFGMMICAIGCYNGYNTSGGAQGVGKSTTNSIVISSITVLILNYLITGLMFIK